MILSTYKSTREEMQYWNQSPLNYNEVYTEAMTCWNDKLQLQWLQVEV